MRIALAQLNFHIGNFELNVKKIIESISKAKKENAHLIVFPELSVCGYPPLDFLDYSYFIDLCENAITKIAEASPGIAVIVGAPSRNPIAEGKNLFNSAFFIHDGRIEKIIHKTLLPTYDVFDEYRYFEPNRHHELIELNGEKIALTICEDLWNVEDDPLYVHCPMDKLVHQKPSFIINIAASPFTYEHHRARKSILSKNARKYHLPIVYVNHIGSQTELIFDGGSLVMNAAGDAVKELALFEEDFFIIDSSVLSREVTHVENEFSKYESVYRALMLGIKDYFRKMGFQQAILGLSGGIDSAIVLVLAVHALGKKNVKALLMPSKFSSEGSVADSVTLAEKIGIEYEIISIEKPYDQFLQSLEKNFAGKPFNVAEENLQARIRGLLLMASCNKHGYVLLNTSNKSELAVGYGTLYGDMCGGLSVIGDLYKIEVYKLSRWINRDDEIIPENILAKPPSAELRPDQKDSDSLPPYEVLDKILFQYIEKFRHPEEIIAMGFDEATVNRVVKLVNSNEYKRKQFAPILRVSPKAFGLGRRMPIVGKY